MSEDDDAPELPPTGAPYRSPPARAPHPRERRAAALTIAGLIVLASAATEAWIGWRQVAADAQTSLIIGALITLLATAVAWVVGKPSVNPDPDADRRPARRRTAIALGGTLLLLAAVTPVARAVAVWRFDTTAAQFAPLLDAHARLRRLLDADEATLVREGSGSIVRHLSIRATPEAARHAVTGQGLVARRTADGLVVDFAQLYLPTDLAARGAGDVRWLAIMRVTLRHGWGYEDSVQVRVQHFDIAIVEVATSTEVARLAIEALPPSRTTRPADRYEVERGDVAAEVAAAVRQLRR